MSQWGEKFFRSIGRSAVVHVWSRRKGSERGRAGTERKKMKLHCYSCCNWSILVDVASRMKEQRVQREGREVKKNKVRRRRQLLSQLADWTELNQNIKSTAA